MKNLILATLVTLLFTLAGCQTMEGLGEDIESAGKALKKKASE